MCYLNEQGHLLISGGIKRMIIVLGFNVFTKEIELILTEKSEIEAAAIILEDILMK